MWWWCRECSANQANHAIKEKEIKSAFERRRLKGSQFTDEFKEPGSRIISYLVAAALSVLLLCTVVRVERCAVELTDGFKVGVRLYQRSTLGHSCLQW